MLHRSVVRTLCASSLIGLASVAVAEGAGPHWSYGGATGPTHWGQLEPEFGSCRTGHAQSPIDIRTSQVEKASLPAIELAYQPSPLKIVDNGHTIQVNDVAGSFITVDGNRYELAQFHFHRPSEESIDGKRHAMVAHLVHKDAEGHLAVVAVLLTPGAINPMVAALWNNLPSHKGHEVDVGRVQIHAT